MTRHGLRATTTDNYPGPPTTLCLCGARFSGPSPKAARDALNRHASLSARLARIAANRLKGPS